MAIFGGLWDAVIAIFLVLVFAEYVKVRAKISKQFNLIAASALFILLAVASMEWLTIAGDAAYWAHVLFSMIGWILLLIGTIWGALELTKAK